LCLGEQLGEGAFGVVMKGYTLQGTFETVALKCIDETEMELKEIYKESEIGRYGITHRLVQCWGLIESNFEFLAKPKERLKILSSSIVDMGIWEDVYRRDTNKKKCLFFPKKK